MGSPLAKESQKLPFVGSDKIIYAMDGIFKYMLHTTLTVEGHLQVPILAQAIDYALAKSPILRSVARLKWFGSYWEVIDDLTPYSILAVKDLSQEPDGEKASRELLESYINETIDITHTPPIKFLLIQLPQERSVFVLKVHHSAVDPAAMLYCIEDIQEAYARRLKGESLPEVGQFVDRTRKQLFRQVSPLLWGRVVWKALTRAIQARRTRPRCFIQFANANLTEAISYRTLEFKDRDYASFRSRCKAFGITANELVMTALCRTIRRWNGEREHLDGDYSIVMPVDLRWYARQGGKAPRIMASFIGGSWVTVPVAEVTTFEATLQYVLREIRFIKENHLGLLANIGFPLLYFAAPNWLRRTARQQYARNPSKIVPTAVFAYLGKVDRALPGFAGCQLTQMVGIGAGFYPVGIDVVVVNVDRSFNVTVTYLKHACPDAEMDQFMALFSEEILGVGLIGIQSLDAHVGNRQATRIPGARGRIRYRIQIQISMMRTNFMRHRLFTSLFISLMFFAMPFRFLAEEGMWLPDTIKDLPLSKMKRMGLTLTPQDIYNPRGVSLADAVVIVDGGTGEFVSPEGLMLTNHHVAYDALVSASIPQTDYVKNGFLAKMRAEEMPAKNYTVSMTKSFKDVTAEVLSSVKAGMPYEGRQQAINAKAREMEEAASNDAESLRADVVEMLNGLNYYLYTYEVLKDVRIVYAPPAAIGNFGGDPDNFEWPRHTGDFTFLRAYVGPNGKSAEYSEKNVPYRPKKFLSISTSGYKEGDYVMVMGYPGATYRYRESYSISYRQNRLYPQQIDLWRNQIAILEEARKRNPEKAIQYQGQIFGISNGLKAYEGGLQGLKRSNLLQHRQEEEATFTKYLDQHPDWKSKYGTVLPRLADLYRDLESYSLKQTILDGLLGSSDTLQILTTAWDHALAQEKPAAERSPNDSDKVIEQIKKNIPNAWKDRDLLLERAFIELYLRQADELPAGQKIETVEKLFAGTSGAERRKAEDEFARQIVEHNRLKSADAVVKLLDMTAAELKSLQDPVFNFAAGATAEAEAINKRHQLFGAGTTSLRPLYIQGMSQWKKTILYPDANRTLRFTYGKVAGYKPRDAVHYDYITSLQGVVEKDTGEEPFDVPEELKKLEEARDFGSYMEPRLSDVPVAFISDTDITGGNSGSPIMNGRGELIGVVFDGNYEGLGSDYVFNPALSRCLAVDIRYVMFVTEKVGGAMNVIQELLGRGRAATAR